MAQFSDTSRATLLTCHPDLIRVFNRVIDHVDCTILVGFRDQAAQDTAFRTGTSKEQWPNSKHNQSPSLAVDVAPYPIDWSDRFRFTVFAGFVLGVAAENGIELRWGGAWQGGFKSNPKGALNDLDHFELVRRP